MRASFSARSNSFASIDVLEDVGGDGVSVVVVSELETAAPGGEGDGPAGAERRRFLTILDGTIDAIPATDTISDFRSS